MQVEDVFYSNGYPKRTLIPFNGLSLSNHEGTLLDGNGGHHQWFYSVGNNENWSRGGSLNDNRVVSGNPAVNLPNGLTSHIMVAQRTSLYFAGINNEFCIKISGY